MPNRITLLTIGSRGDVQPFVALGQGLRAAGHQVTLATHRIFEDFVTAHGLDFMPVSGDPHDFLEMLASEKAGANLLTFVQQLNRWSISFFDEVLRDFEAVCQNTDLLVYNFLGVAALNTAEKANIPAVAGYLVPLGQPTTAYPSVNFSNWFMDTPWLNRLTHQLDRAGIGYNMRGRLNHWRREVLGLPPHPLRLVYPYAAVNGSPVTTLYGYSAHLLPRPDDYLPHVHVTGYWFLDDNPTWQPPADLTAFLEAGEPPIYVGFGSLIDRNAQQLVETVIRAVRASGNRLLLLSGWAEYKNTIQSDDIFVVPEAPHDWLFPRMKAIVHHGGAGTTAAGLRAGKPTVVVPFFGDQPFWGRTIARQGLGPEPILAGKLTVERLTQAIHTATASDTIRQKASITGDAIRAENGVQKAVEIIETLL